MAGSNERPTSSGQSSARNMVFGLGVRELGIGAVAVAILLALVSGVGRVSRKQPDELAAVRAELAIRGDIAEVYQEQFAAVQAQVTKARLWAEAQTTEPIRTWARERLRRLEALAATVSREDEAKRFAAGKAKVAQLCARGDAAGARRALEALPAPTFPSPSEFAQLRRDIYEAPLATFSRQNPEFYRALRQFDAEVAKRDETALRAELTAATADSVSPQAILKADLLAAVAAPDDPLVAEWSTLASALDYFENPNGATLAHWRRAQAASRANDWPTAAAEMQAIVADKVHTRQPFRAAVGWALLKARPDQPTDAYPFLAEAAASGDKKARSWVAKEELRNERFAQAQRWAEAAVADGQTDVVPLLVGLYEKQGENAGDPAHQISVLERVADRPETPAEALVALGKLYERTDPPGSKGRAFQAYSRAAAKGSAKASLEVARCALRGRGTPENLDVARDAAARAFAEGERDGAAAVLGELMQRAPDRTAGTVLKLLQTEQVSGGGGYTERRVVDGEGVSQLRAALARYLDQTGMYSQAARLYAASRDPGAARRHGELTASHVCETCGGKGKVQVTANCPTCGGKGRQICSFCGGTGYNYVPGSPPCTSCGGTGTILQDRRTVACSTCGGSGKGKGSVIKQDCPHCDHGNIRCPECTGGQIKVIKDCPDCRGKGTWSLIDRSAE